jgi:hypothetical protein
LPAAVPGGVSVFNLFSIIFTIKNYMANNYHLNDRVQGIDGYKGTVRYIGEVCTSKNKNEIWIGEECVSKIDSNL